MLERRTSVCFKCASSLHSIWQVRTITGAYFISTRFYAVVEEAANNTRAAA